jgi:hypothetical protein
LKQSMQTPAHGFLPIIVFARCDKAYGLISSRKFR